MSSIYENYKVENLFKLNEELTDAEIDTLEPGNTLIDKELKMHTVRQVLRDEKGTVMGVKLVSYESADSPEDDTEEYTIRVDAKQLRKYEIA